MKTKKILSVFLAAALVTASAFGNMSLVFAGGDTLAPRPGEQGYLGENQPVYHGHRAMDILNWSPETDEYSDFMRAEVPLQQRNEAFAATQANPQLSQEVASLSLTEDYGNEFFNPYNYNDDFAQYVFNFWQYLDYRASWHGVVTNPTPDSLFDPEAGWWERAYEFGILNIPNPAYTNAAHKNGVQSLGCIFFPRQEHTNDLIFRDETGRFPAADKLVEIAKWYGFDGYFINAEERLPADFMPVYEEFCRQMTEQGIYIQVYASNLYGQNNQSSWGSINYYNKDATQFSNWIKGTDDETIAANSLYMNPDPSKSMVDGSVSIMESLGLDARKTVFNTLEAGQTGFSGARGSLYNLLDENLVPRTGIANLGAGTVWAHLDEQVFGHTGNNSYNENRRADPEYQKYVFARERSWWSGAANQPYYTNSSDYVREGVTFLNKDTTKYTEEERQQLLQAILDADANPYVTANDPDRAKPNEGTDLEGKEYQSWPGMAAFISERSVIKGSNFVTNFNTGHGMQYFKNGEVSNDHEWSNINDQDILPTWQWWYETSDGSEATLNFDFDYGTKYNPAFELNQIGGYDGSSSLVAKGPMSAEHFLRLYKTKMDINENSKLDITFFKTTADDASQMKVGLIFEDAPETVEYITVNNSGKQSTEWMTETLDLSAYAGRTLAAFGLAFDPNGEELADYQMNIGEIAITDNDNAPAAPTGLTIDRAFNTDETYLSWDLADYDEVQKYNVYAVFEDGTEMYMGGIYDDNYYVKSLYDNKGVVSFKVTAEGDNGVESEAAVVVRDYNKSASNLTVEEGSGVLNVSWTNPDMDYASIRADVTLPYNYAGNTETYTAEFAKDAVSGTVEVPVTDGSNYYLRLSYLDAEGNVISSTDISGTLVDDHCDAYEGTVSKSIPKGSWKIQNPLVYDWWHLTAWDSNGNVLKNNVTRGVDDLTGLNLTTNEDGYGYIEIQLEDFNGNVSEKTRVYYGEPPKTNKTLLEKTYEYALNQSTEGVVDSAVKNFEEAKAAAKAVLDNAYASQDEINTAWSNLVDAIHGLGLLQGDKTNLKMLIDMAEAMDESKYVDTNWKQLVDALEAAKNVYNDGDAMEEDVQPAADALLDAILAQRFKADKSILEDLINKANDIDLTNYTEESVAVFQAAFKAANAVLADESLSEDEQDVVDNAVSELEAAIENLSAKDDTSNPDDDKDDNNSNPDDGKNDNNKPDDGKGDPNADKDDSAAESPATGDNGSLMIWIVAFISLAGFTVLFFQKKKAQQK